MTMSRLTHRSSWHDEFNGRAMRYTVANKLAFLLVALPMSFQLDSQSVTEIAISLLLAPAQGHLPEAYPDRVFATYWHVSLTLAFVLTHPILICYALDIAAPHLPLCL